MSTGSMARGLRRPVVKDPVGMVAVATGSPGVVRRHAPLLAALFARQHGLATRAQLRAIGVSADVIRWHLARTGHLVLPGVVRSDRSPLSGTQRMVAALLYAGAEAAISGSAAARWYGVTSAVDRGFVEVSVPAPKDSRRVRWVQIRRTCVPEDPFELGPLVFVPPTRAIVEAARFAPGQRESDAIIIEAVQRRLASVDDLAAQLARMGRQRSAQVNRSLELAAVGVWSPAEADALALVETSAALGPVTCNPRLRTAHGQRLPTPDVWFDDVALAVMVHSHEHHAYGSKWDKTVERDGILAAAGVIVIGVTPRAVREDGRAVLVRIEQAYRQASCRPRPDVVVVP